MQVTKKLVAPDPIVVHEKDIVCWMWPKHVSSSLAPYVNEQEADDGTLFCARYVMCFHHAYCHAKRVMRTWYIRLSLNISPFFHPAAYFLRPFPLNLFHLCSSAFSKPSFKDFSHSVPYCPIIFLPLFYHF